MTILLTLTGVYFIYDQIKLDICIENNDALQALKNGSLLVVTEVSANAPIECFTVARIDTDTIVVFDKINKFRKTYKNGILIEIAYENELDLFFSFINPLRILGKPLTHGNQKIHTVRDNSDYLDTLSRVQNNDSHLENQMIIIDDVIFIN